MTKALEGGEWSAARPRLLFPPGKDPVPILQEAGWAPGPVWTGRKSHPERDSIPDRPSHSQLLYQLSYPAHINNMSFKEIYWTLVVLVVVVVVGTAAAVTVTVVTVFSNT